VAPPEPAEAPDRAGLEPAGHRRRPGVEPFPDRGGCFWRRQRVEDCDFAAGFDAGRIDELLPVEARPPVRMLEAPDPEPRRDVENLGHAPTLSRASRAPASPAGPRPPAGRRDPAP